MDSGRASEAPPTTEVLCGFRAFSADSALACVPAAAPRFQAAPILGCDWNAERNRRDTKIAPSCRHLPIPPGGSGAVRCVVCIKRFRKRSFNPHSSQVKDLAR